MRGDGKWNACNLKGLCKHLLYGVIRRYASCMREESAPAVRSM